MRIGVQVLTSEIPPASGNIYNTAAAYMIGVGDWGPVGAPVKCTTINDVTNTIGPRSATNSTLWDAADVYFREGGAVLYLSRVVGPTPVSASLTLEDASSNPTVTYTAAYPGSYGNGLKLAVTVSGSDYTVLVEDGSGNTLESFGPFVTANGNAALLASKSLYGAFVQATGSGHTTAGPEALTATSLSGGTDDKTDATLANWQSALTAFGVKLGPGQVCAPGQTNTTLNGIWSALGTHAQANNRVAICDMDDGETASVLISDLASFGTSSVGSYCGFWAGNLVVPGPNNTPGVTRTISPSPVICALCARVDASGNVNQAAAGDPNGLDLALHYVSGFTGTSGAPLYGQSDIDALNVAGINTFNDIFNVLQNYGFVSSVLETNDTIYWQLNHARLRMALQADAQVLGQPFVFSQISQSDIGAFGSDLAADLSKYVTLGAISTIAPDGSADQGFTVDTGPTVNTAASMGAGQLNANVSFRPAPFAQLVTVTLNAVPTTASI